MFHAIVAVGRLFVEHAAEVRFEADGKFSRGFAQATRGYRRPDFPR
jgi:hypothetical protein